MAQADCHVVVFNVPWPANYGGVIDSYYRIRALAQSGLRMALHCFDYGRGPAPELQRLCPEVYYYPRRPAAFGMIGMEPYIVSSRASVDLHHRLLRDNQPILFDGLHTTHYLDDPQLAHRNKVVRMHNVEWQYYRSLADVERRIFREMYFHLEAYRLKRYEKNLRHANAVACISQKEAHYYQDLLAGSETRVVHVAAGHPWTVVERPVPNGERQPYALYHGNLSVGENIQAVSFLIREVFADLDIPLIVAGMDPDIKLLAWAEGKANVELLANPSEEELDRLVRGARLHVLPTFQSTGIKLKLLRVLFTGGRLLVNSPMVEEAGLSGFCRVEDGAEAWKAAVAEEFGLDYSEEDFQMRKSLERLMDPGMGAQKTLNLLFPDSFPQAEAQQLGV